jgi:hypothetical protein
MPENLNRSVWPRRLFLMAVIAPCALLWGELFTRELLPQSVDARMNIYKPDSVVGYIYEPNSTTYEKGKEYNALYRINGVGLRDRDYGAKDPGKFRVLLLGDSFSVSHGLAIEDSLSRQLERSLQTMIDPDRRKVTVEVVNTATGGYSPYNYWKAYQRWARVFRPDAVVVGLSPDDYDCSNEDSEYLIQDGDIQAAYKAGEKPPDVGGKSITGLRKWLAWNSEFYVLMRSFFYYNDLAGQASLWVTARGEAQLGQLRQYVVPPPEDIGKAWARTFHYLQKLKHETAADGAALILVPIPLSLEIDPGDFRRTLAASGLTPARVDPDQPLRMISEFAGREGLAVLDPRAELREREKYRRCYFVYDGHWNADGIRVATSSIAKQWRELGLPPFDNSFVLRADGNGRNPP